MTTIKALLEDLLTGRRFSAEEAVDLHFAPSFRQRVNGSWTDRAGFLAVIVGLRDSLTRVDIEVLDEFVDGDRYAERHVLDLTMRGGEQVRQEVYAFGRLDPDGRIVRIEETTLPIGGDDE
jgi:hypothetical protein